MKPVDYKSSGVDIDAGNESVRRIRSYVEATFSQAVLSPLGSFAALYDLKPLLTEYEHPVLVQSIDGVGTKMMVASMMQKFDTIGIDLVSATTNDIIVVGAKPLTLLDYIANDKLDPVVVEKIVEGIAQACYENAIALVGGETAEMPGTYQPNEHDLVGIVTGVVDKNKIITGENIIAGDLVFGLPASGLHTNGFSLARKLLFATEHYTIDTFHPELNQTIGETLLIPHVNYHRIVQFFLQQTIPIKGMAHITGGGLLENIPRILPPNVSVELKQKSWPLLPIFSLLTAIGHLPANEAYRTFNMGIGMVLIVGEEHGAALRQAARMFDEMPIYEIGQVVSGPNKVRII